MRTLGQSIATSAKWSGLLGIVQRGISTVTIAILARLLGPADFGLLAGSLLFTSLGQIICDAGLGKALVQSREAPEKAANVMFWTNVLLSLIIYGLLWLAAPWLGGLFGCGECALALRVLGVEMIIFSLASVHQSLLIRRFEFGQLFWLKTLAALLPSVVTVTLAWHNFGGWALVAGALLGQTVNAVLLWTISTWRPRLQYDHALATQLGRFGRWALVENLVSWLWVWGPGFIIGTVFGIAELGAYRVGMSVVGAIYASVGEGFRPALYAGLVKLQHDSGELWRVFRRANRLTTAIVLPVGVLLMSTGDVVTASLFGPRWSAMGIVLAIGGAWYSASWLVRFNPELYRAVGRPDINAWLVGALAAWVVVAAIVMAPYGIVALLLASASSAAFEIGAQLYIVKRVFRVSPWYLWHDTRACLAASLIMGVFLLAMRVVLAHEAIGVSVVVETAALLALGSIAYVVGLWRIDPRFVLDSARLAWQAARSA